MIENISSIHTKSSHILNEYFLGDINKRIDEQKFFLLAVEQEIRSYYSSLEKHKKDNSVYGIVIENNKFHQEVFNRIKEKYQNTKSKNFSADFEEYVSEYQNYLHTLDDELVLEQHEERFKVNSGDSFFLKVGKYFKIFFFKISQLPSAFSNFFRKIFKKEPKQKKRWHHNVPLKRVTSYYYQYELLQNIIPSLKEYYSAISLTSYRAFNLVESVDQSFFDLISRLKNNEKYELRFEEVNYKIEIESCLKILDEVKEKLSEEKESQLSKIRSSYENAFYKSGTIELSSSKFSKNKIDRKEDELNDDYKSLSKGWNNALHALYDDWRLTEELSLIRSSMLAEYLHILNTCSNKISSVIIPQINEVKNLLQKSSKKISGLEKNSEVKSFLLNEQSSNRTELNDNIVPKIIDTILSQDIPSLVDELEVVLSRSLDSLSKKRSVVKSNEYKREIKSSEIDSISPYELIAFETAPKLLSVTKSIKTDILLKLDEAQKNIFELGQIADFNIESAIVMIEGGEKPAEEAVRIASEGLHRAIAKTDEVNDSLNKINDLLLNKLGASVNNFNDDLIALTNSEEVFQIKLRIAKAKAVKRTEQLKKDALNYAKNAIPIIKENFNKGFNRVSILSNTLRKRFGLLPKTSIISSAVSDFLAETQNAIMKLPFVYQRLFHLEALKDERFFQGRENELTHLNSAFANWQNGYYAPTVIVGEKGSGSTSLINIFTKNLDTAIPEVKIIFEFSAADESLLLKRFNEELGFTSSSLKELEDELLNSAAKKIIIIENLQHLFLKKVNGFASLKSLLQLISKTNKKVFWVVSSSLYAWTYLDKVMNISDNFGYVVRLETLKSEQITNIILARHRVSGYNIIYEASEEDTQSKTYKKLNDDDRQDYLQKEYFTDLNKIAKSNISIALLFWLRSTKNVTKNTLTISSLKNLDFNFLRSLPISKIFSLYVLLLHDGLTEENHSAIFSNSFTNNNMMLRILFDDGLIVEKEGYYKINPLLYRQTVDLLQAKNIIH